MYKKKFVKPTSTTKKYKTPQMDTTVNTNNIKYLIIVESPSKCKKIEEYLGSEYKCIATRGHICKIKDLKSIDIKNEFDTKFSLIEDKIDYIENLRIIIGKFDPSKILLATDDDREGEAISWHICQIFGLPVETTPRIIFHEITKSAIIKAVSSPTIINMGIVRTQLARQILDILIGYKISPFLWKHIYNSKTESLSAGRCQTPALRLVYDNNKEDKTINTKYKTVGRFFNRDIQFHLNRDFENSVDMKQFIELSKDYGIANSYKLEIGKPTPSTSSPPKPLNTSRLLQQASNLFNYSPLQTMNYCQILYQSGYITYMRTESSKYSGEFLVNAGKYITEKWNSAGTDIGDFTTLENTDSANPHEAIRITNITVLEYDEPKTTGEMTDDASSNNKIKALYRHIWRTTIESCMSASKSNITTVSILAPQNTKYVYNLEIPVLLGWRKVAEKRSVVDDQNKTTGLLLYFSTILTAGSPIICNKIESNIVIKTRHSHYTEAGLIQRLEAEGIGRPSTFASIVNTLIDRKYVEKRDIEGAKIQCLEYILDNGETIQEKGTIQEKMIIQEIIIERILGNEKNKLVIQPMGILSVDFLIEHFDNIFSYEYTKQMENRLDQILVNNGVWYSICDECLIEINGLSKTAMKIKKQVYKINEKYELVFQKYGPVLRYIENPQIQLQTIDITASSDDDDSDDDSDDGNDDDYDYDDDYDGNDDDKPVKNIQKNITKPTRKSTTKSTTKQNNQTITPIIKRTKYSYKSIKPGLKLDLEKLKHGEYIIDDLIEINTETLGKCLVEGEYYGIDFSMKSGQYGPYVEFLNNLTGELVKESIKTIGIPLNNITIIDIVDYLKRKKGGFVKDPDAVRAPPCNKSILRVLTTDISVRKGKFGPYIYYKTDVMKTPTFYNIKEYSKKYANCEITVMLEWIYKTYNINKLFINKLFINK
jgi:DNA topoisomerase-1